MSEFPVRFIRTDGGRAAAGYVGEAGDCVARAVAVASGRSYQEVYDALSVGCRSQRLTRGRSGYSIRRRSVSARNGVDTSRKWFKDYMRSLGFRWVPTMQVGQGCKVHLRAEELPSGRLVVAVSKHYVAVLNGIIHDTFDPSRNGTRCVYGYWVLT